MTDVQSNKRQRLDNNENVFDDLIVAYQTVKLANSENFANHLLSSDEYLKMLDEFSKNLCIDMTNQSSSTLDITVYNWIILMLFQLFFNTSDIAKPETLWNEEFHILQYEKFDETFINSIFDVYQTFVDTIFMYPHIMVDDPEHGPMVLFNDLGDRFKTYTAAIKMKVEALKMLMLSNVQCRKQNILSTNNVTELPPNNIFEMELVDADKMMILYRHVLTECRKLGLLKCGNSLYKRIRNKTGHDTFAYGMHMTIKDFANRCWSSTKNPQLALLASKIQTSQLIGKIEDAHEDVSLPEYQPNRHIYSFEDGIYIANIHKFITYESNNIPPSTISSKYFENLFIKHIIDTLDPTLANIDIHSIPTPHLDSVLKYQLFEKLDMPTPDELSAYYWSLVVIGRLFYDVGERDNWQIMAYFYGVGGAGKGLLTSIIYECFDESFIGAISSDSQSTFGLQHLRDKHIVVAPDFGKRTSALDQGQIQCMVSGESVVINIKNQESIIVPRWLAQLLFVSNILPDWENDQGQLSRRMVVLHFSKQAKKLDVSLKSKIRNEMAAILLKINLAYLKETERYFDCVDGTGFRSICSPLLLAKSDNILNTLNPYWKFLQSNYCEIGEEFSCMLQKFDESFRSYIQLNRTSGSVSEESRNAILKQMNISLVVEDSYNNKVQKLFGVRIVD